MTARRPTFFPNERRLVGADQASWLINTHYTAIYGQFIRYETPRTMRLKIVELQLKLPDVKPRGGVAYVMLARTIRDYERIGELLEMMPSK